MLTRKSPECAPAPMCANSFVKLYYWVSNICKKLLFSNISASQCVQYLDCPAGARSRPMPPPSPASHNSAVDCYRDSTFSTEIIKIMVTIFLSDICNCLQYRMEFKLFFWPLEFKICGNPCGHIRVRIEREGASG